MDRIACITSTAEEHGVSLPEYLALDITVAFSMTMEQVAHYLGELLKNFNYPEPDGRLVEVVLRCLSKGWVEVSPAGFLVVTAKGLLLKRKISAQVPQCRRK
jgi:hypothetical protein